MKRLNYFLWSIVCLLLIWAWLGARYYENKLDTTYKWGEVMMTMFYEEKDAVTCLLQMLWDNETFDWCKYFIDKAVENYKSANEYFTAQSEYFPNK